MMVMVWNTLISDFNGNGTSPIYTVFAIKF